MTRTLKLLQFVPPWRGQNGLRRFLLHPNGHMETIKPLKAHKALRKATPDIDGLVLRPTWPTRRGLVLVGDGEKTYIHELIRDRVSVGQRRIDIDDPSFRMDALERGFYRHFTFETRTAKFVVRDLGSRLIGPQRIATEIFPEDDFSPFARLMSMLETPTLRHKFLADLGKKRFKYSRWVDRASDRLSQFHDGLKS